MNPGLLLGVILVAAGTTLAVIGLASLLRLRRRRRRRRAAERAASDLGDYNDSLALWGELEQSPSGTHPATRLHHGAGASLYFARRMHDHRPGSMCHVDGCNWPLR